MNMKLKQNKHLLDERPFLFSHRPGASIFWVRKKNAFVFFHIRNLTLQRREIFLLFNSFESVP
jgi:hypothetical protein